MQKVVSVNDGQESVDVETTADITVDNVIVINDSVEITGENDDEAFTDCDKDDTIDDLKDPSYAPEVSIRVVPGVRPATRANSTALAAISSIYDPTTVRDALAS